MVGNKILATVKYLLIILLACSTAHAVLWDDTESWKSAGQAIGIGAGVPTVGYLAWNRLTPTHRPDKRWKRIAATHIAVIGVSVLCMRGNSLHDQDAAYTNVILAGMLSLQVNMIVDAVRVAKWRRGVAKGIKRQSEREKHPPI